MSDVHGPAALLAQDSAPVFLGKDFFPWMVLALGAALVVGNGLALLRPKADAGPPPVGRALVMIGLGFVASGWGLASLIA